MNKLLGIIGLSTVLLLSSCVTTVKTARQASTSSSIRNATIADLEVTDHRITHTIIPSKEIQRGGISNVKQAVIQEALDKYGNADLLVEPEFVYHMKNKFIFGKEVTSITVSGRPAYYKNFRTLHDSVWATPGFYGQPNVKVVNTAAGTRKSGVAGVLGSLLGGQGKSRYASGPVARSGFGGKFEAIGGTQKGSVEKGGDYKTDRSGYAGGLLTLGYHIDGHWFVGAGTGFFWDFDDIDEGFIPIFGDVRFNFSSRSRSTWFVDYKIGASVFSRDRDYGVKPGLFLMPSVGYSFGGFDVALQWGVQQIVEKHGGDYRMDINHFGLSLGVSF